MVGGRWRDVRLETVIFNGRCFILFPIFQWYFPIYFPFLNFALLNFFLVNFLNVNFRAVLKAHAQDSPTGVTTTATTLFVLHIELYICFDLIKGTSRNCKYVLTI